MTIKCPKCGKEIPADFGITWGDACPFCMTTLEEPAKSSNSSGTTTLGDANAISGGIHNTDSHNVDSHDVHTTTNNTTHNVTNYVQQAAKSADEIIREQKFLFRQYCEKIIQKGGLLSSEGKILIDRKMAELGLSSEEGDTVVSSVKASKMRSLSELNVLAKIKLDSAKSAIKLNSQNLDRSLSELKAQSLIYNNEELHFYYNMLLSALDAKQCIERYEKRKNDSYWMAFWAYLAYIKSGDMERAEQTLAWLSTFESMPQGNLILLDAAGRINEIIGNEDSKESQRILLEEFSSDCSDLLDGFKESLIAIYSNKMGKPDFFSKYFSLGVDSIASTKADSPKKEDKNTRNNHNDTAANPSSAKPKEDDKNQKAITQFGEAKDFPYDISSLRNEYGELRELSDDEIERVFSFLTKESESGNAEAKYFLAQMYFTGQGVNSNSHKGFQLLKEASSKGFAPAGIAMGACYLYGNGVKKDIAEAEKRLKPAMTSLNPEVWQVLGDLFTAKGVPALARVWYEKVDTQGQPSAEIHNLEVLSNNTCLDIRFELILSNCRNHQLSISALFFWGVGAKIISTCPDYSENGQLASKTKLAQITTAQSRQKITISIPFNELPIKRDGVFSLKSDIILFDVIQGDSRILLGPVAIPFEITLTGGCFKTRPI